MTTTPNMYEDYLAMSAEIVNPTKDAQGYNYKYPELPEMLADLRPIMNAHRFGLVQTVEVLIAPNGKCLVTDNMEKWQVCFSRLIHVSGDTITSELPFTIPDVPLNRQGTPSMNEMQWLGACQTYTRRYGLMALLGLSGEDSDAAEKREPPAPIVRIDETQQMQLLAKAEIAGVELAKILAAAHVSNVAEIPFDKYATIMHRLDATIKAKVDQRADDAVNE